MNKSIILPLIAVIALLVKYGTGYEIPQEEMDTLADGVLAGLTIFGILKNHKKV